MTTPQKRIKFLYKISPLVIFRVVGSDHVVFQVSNSNFGANSYSSENLYQIQLYNDVQPTTLSGAECRALLEGDGSSINIKGSSVEMQARYCPAILTSNLCSLQEFKKQTRQAGVHAKWTEADFAKILNVEEGRIGCEARTEEPVCSLV